MRPLSCSLTPCACVQIERVVAERTDKDGTKRYLCKFQGLPYGESTWELVSDVTEHGGQAAIDEYLRREQRLLAAPQGVDMARRMLIQQHRAIEQQPPWLKARSVHAESPLSGAAYILCGVVWHIAGTCAVHSTAKTRVAGMKWREVSLAGS